MKGYKGFNRDMTCLKKQYKQGEEYYEDIASLCNAGMHFCEHPLDCLGYYSPNKGRYFEVEAPDNRVSTEVGDDTKRVTKHLKIGVELGIHGMVEAAIRFVFDRAISKNTDCATGYRGAASATGFCGAASATGNYGAASATGYKSVACALGRDCAASGTIGNWLVIAERDEGWNVVSIVTAFIDGKEIKENTPYLVKNGKIVEA